MQKGTSAFAPNSDRESGFPQTVMSALPPKADMSLHEIRCSLIQFNAPALTLNLFICFNSINSLGFPV
jgi:hypothetical protein